MKQVVLQAFEHQDYPFEELVKRIPSARDVGHNPLFDVLFTMLHQDRSSLQLKDLLITPFEFDTGLTKFDLIFEANDYGEAIQFCIDYSTALFRHETIEGFSHYYRRILQAIIANIDVKLCDIDFLSEQEQQYLLVDVNENKEFWSGETTLHQLFETCAQQQPDNIALVYLDKSLCYGELNARANQLARALHARGVGLDTRVGLMCDPSLELLIGLLGILKAGGCYVPLALDAPQARLNYIVADSKIGVLVTKREFIEQIEFAGDVIDIEHDLDGIENTNLPALGTAKHLAYVIYTSGTTGKPKGVMIEHRQITSRLLNSFPLFACSVQDTWTLYHSYSFDLSIWEIFGALFYGGRLVIVSRECAQDTQAFLQLIANEYITMLCQTPAACYRLVRAASAATASQTSVRCLFIGGDALQPQHLASWHQQYPNTRLINIYGPTEISIVATYKEITTEDIKHNRCLIGRPLPGTTCYVLRDERFLLPPGMIGELFVGGYGVARGYLNLSELTAERFIPALHNYQERLYKTGDLVKRMPDGDLEFIGRSDGQVKIRGLRIELGEIEAWLLTHEDVQEVVVASFKDAEGIQELYAYVVGKKPLSAAILSAHLAKNVPLYMIPSHFIFLAEIPLTEHGKINRQALPKSNVIHSFERIYVAPRTHHEHLMVVIWQQVLEIPRIGVTDNFFEVGGHSLKAMRLAADVRDALGVYVPLRTIYEHPTIQQMLENINKPGHVEDDKQPVRLLNAPSSAAPALFCFPPMGGG